VVSWRTEPGKIAGQWLAYRQVDTESAPLFHAAGEEVPSQPDGRWHRQGEGYAQYLALEAPGAWAELIRYERIRSHARGQQYVRRLWLAFVDETDIADLSTFERYVECGLDPRLAVGDHDGAQQLADALRAAGFRGLLSPNAALAGTTNLTLFGERYEKVLLTNPENWQNPQPRLRIPCSLVAEAPPPVELITQVCFRGMEHDGYRDFLREHGLPRPSGTP
jgi:hypothetical protein